MKESFKGNQENPEQVALGEEMMSPQDLADSKFREKGFKQLNKEDRELLPFCDLKIIEEPEASATIIRGKIKGQDIELIYSEGKKYEVVGYMGSINGIRIDEDKVRSLWRKYVAVARFQTYLGPVDTFGKPIEKSVAVADDIANDLFK